jgi:hypothetical protein
MASTTWTGSGNQNWSVATWSDGVPVAGEDVTLTPSAAATLTLNVDTPVLNSLSILSGSLATLSVAADTLSVGAGGVTFDAGAVTIAGGKLTTTGSLTIDASTLSGSGVVSASGIANAGVLKASGGTLTLTGALSGAGAVTAGGAAAGTLLIESAGSQSAATFGTATGSVIEIGAAGALTLTQATSIGSDTLTLLGAGSTFSNSAATGASLTTGTISGIGVVDATISASGAAHVTETGGGTLELTQAVSGASLLLSVGAASGDKLLLDASGDSAKAVSFASATGAGTLEIGADATLALSAAVSAGTNEITLDGASSQLSDSAGLTFTSGALSGQGDVGAAVSATGAAKIDEIGGALTISGAIAATTATLGVGATSNDLLLLEGATNSAGSVSFSSAAGAGTLEVGASSTLTVAALLSLGSNTISLGSAAALTDANGVTLTGGMIAGPGGIAAATKVTGYGTVGAGLVNGTGAITASGGTLDLTGSVNQSTGTDRVLAVATVSGADLKIDGTAASGAITIANVNQTLEIGAAGSLTVTAAETLSAGLLQMDGGTLGDSSGVVLGAGTSNGSISGSGKIAAAVTRGGTGTGSSIAAGGGTLEITGAVGSATAAMGLLGIGSGATDTLLLDAASYATQATFQGATGALEIGAGGALTLTDALAIGANTVELEGSGSQLTDAAGIALAGGSINGAGAVGSGTSISGYGSVASTVAAGAATLTASGGTLEFKGAVGANGTPVASLVVGAGATDRLLLDGESYAAAASFAGSAQTLEINTAGSLTLTDVVAVGANTLQIDGSGTLDDGAGVTLAGGTIDGTGTIGSATSISGWGTVALTLTSGSEAITANGDGTGDTTLDLTGTVSGRALSIGTANASDLKIDGTASASALTIGSANQTLEIGAAGSLTLSGAESITNGTIKLDGGSLSDSSVLTIGAGATLAGDGTVGATTTISGSGDIDDNVSGGTLELEGALTGTTTLSIGAASGSAATLILDGADSAASADFYGSGGMLEVAAGGSLSLTGSLGVFTGDTLLLEGSGVQVSASGAVGLGGGAISGTGALGSGTRIGGFGTINVAVTGSQIVPDFGGDLVFTNTVTNASVSNQGGNVEFDANATLSSVTFTNQLQGELTVGAGATLSVTGGQVTLAANGIAGSGVVENTDILGNGTITTEFEGGTLTAGGIPTVATDTLLSGTVDATAATAFYISSVGGFVDYARLKFSGTVGTATVVPTITFDAYTGSTWGGLDLSSEGTGSTFASNFHAVIDGFTGTGATQSTSDQIIVQSSAAGGDKLDWEQNGSSGILYVEDSGGNVLEQLNLNGLYQESQFNLDALPSLGWDVVTYTACYVRGARILAARGEIAVEALRVGEYVVTASGALRPIVWIGHRRIDILRHPDPDAVRPVRIRAHAFGEGLPHRDLWLSPEHAVFVEEKLIPIGRLVNGGTIAEQPVERVEYWHVELESHDVLLAEGLPAESYLDCGNRRAFDNSGDGVVALHPDWRARALGRDFASPRVVARWREALAARAVELGHGDGIEAYAAERRARACAAGTNYVRNPRGEGAVVGRLGAGGEAPQYWRLDAPDGVAVEVSGAGEEGGLPFVDIRFCGTAAAAGACCVYPEPGAGIGARPGQDWTVSGFLRLVGGGLQGLEAVNLYVDEMDAAGAYVGGAAYAQSWPCADDLALQRACATRRLQSRDAAAMTAYLQLPVASGAALDLTLRVAGMQFERGRYASDPILPPAGAPGIAARAGAPAASALAA